MGSNMILGSVAKKISSSSDDLLRSLNSEKKLAMRQIRNAKIGTSKEIAEEISNLKRLNNIDNLKAPTVGQAMGDGMAKLNLDSSSSIVNNQELGFNNINGMIKTKEKEIAEEQARRASRLERAKKVNSEVNVLPSNKNSILLPGEAPPQMNSSVQSINNELKGSSIFSAPSHRELKKARYDSMSNYKQFRESERLEEGIKAYSKQQYDNPVLTEMANFHNTTPEQLTQDQINSFRDIKIDSSRLRDTTIRDQLGYNKIPQKVTGVLSTAWLVNKLASDKGQQTNAQLYNQQPYNYQ